VGQSRRWTFAAKYVDCRIYTGLAPGFVHSFATPNGIEMKNPLLRRLTTYFINGLLIITPLFITVLIVYRLFVFFDELIPVEKKWPGLGILILVGSILLIGVLFTRLLPNPLQFWLGPLLEKAPLIKTIYSSIKDLTSAFVGNKKRFNRPVMVRMSKDVEIFKPGFITDTDLSHLGLDEQMVSVYMPHSYAFSGNLFIVPASLIIPLDANPADVMKYIVSGGVSELKEDDKKN